MMRLALLSVGAVWALWGLYVLVMGLYRAHLTRRLSKPAYALAMPFLLLGYAADIVVNITVASVLLLELPRHLLVTDRLEHHLGREDWRGDLARWICTHLLDVFDPSGTHCNPISKQPS